mgnify:CR=1 FL=1
MLGNWPHTSKNRATNTFRASANSGNRATASQGNSPAIDRKWIDPAALYAIASGKAGFEPAGFASNGYGALSPGGYSLRSALLAEVVLTAGFLAAIKARKPEVKQSALPFLSSPQRARQEPEWIAGSFHNLQAATGMTRNGVLTCSST